MDATIEKIAIEIERLKTSVHNLMVLGKELPALDRNLQRVAASLKMLELNFVDPVRLGGSPPAGD